jgi:hypothetical protein
MVAGLLDSSQLVPVASAAAASRRLGTFSAMIGSSARLIADLRRLGIGIGCSNDSLASP